MSTRNVKNKIKNVSKKCQIFFAIIFYISIKSLSVYKQFFLIRKVLNFISFFSEKDTFLKKLEIFQTSFIKSFLLDLPYRYLISYKLETWSLKLDIFQTSFIKSTFLQKLDIFQTSLICVNMVYMYKWIKLFTW